MDILHVLPFISTAVTFVFAGVVLNRYLKGRRWHSLLWGLGLVLYGLGTFAEAYLAVAWSGFWLRVWYLTGAMLTAAWLGQGSVYLLVRRRGLAHGLMAGLALVSLIAVVMVFTAPLDPGAFQLGLPISPPVASIIAAATSSGRKGMRCSLGMLLMEIVSSGLRDAASSLTRNIR